MNPDHIPNFIYYSEYDDCVTEFAIRATEPQPHPIINLCEIIIFHVRLRCKSGQIEKELCISDRTLGILTFSDGSILNLGKHFIRRCWNNPARRFIKDKLEISESYWGYSFTFGSKEVRAFNTHPVYIKIVKKGIGTYSGPYMGEQCNIAWNTDISSIKVQLGVWPETAIHDLWNAQ